MSKPESLPTSADPQARARALQSLLIEKEIVSTDAIDAVLRKYEEDVGPMNGAQVVARAWTDPEYKEWLLEDGTEAVAELGVSGLEAVDIGVFENTPDVHNVIVCSLCSCYPWALLGLPPTWYKMPPYRSNMVKKPRETLRKDFGVELDDDVEIKVWDTSAEVRYMVLPQRPAGSEGMSEEELANLVTRDSMVGVERLGNKHVDGL